MKKLLNIFLIVLIVVLLGCEKEVFLGEPEPPNEEFGTIIINSNPSGARIFLNNRDTGFSTPCTLKFVPIGYYNLTLKLYRYDYYTIGISINHTTTFPIYHDFTKDPANLSSLECYSTPNGATIYLNDSLTNKITPYTFKNLLPGDYKVKMSLKEHRSDSSIVTLFSKNKGYVSLKLIDTSKVVVYNIGNSKLLSDNINCLTVDRKNHIWIGTTVGMQEIYGSNWKYYNFSNTPLTSENITALHCDELNRLWVGTSKGLFLYDGINWIDYSKIIGEISITSITSDKSINIYVGSYSGLIKISGNNFKKFDNSNSKITDNNIKALAVDKDNNLWIGTVYAGIVFYDGKDFQVYDNKAMGLQISNQINALVIDNNNILWGISGDSDLISFDGKTWFKVKHIYFAISMFNQNDYLFISQKHGYSIYNKNTNINRYYYSEDFNLSSFWANGSVMNHDGDIYIGTLGNGLIKMKKGSY